MTLLPRTIGTLVVFAFSNISTAAVLCKTTDDTLKVRDICKKHEIRLDPAMLGLQGPPGPRGLQGIQGPPGAPRAMSAIIRSVTVSVQNGEVAQIRKVDCLPGEIAVGGAQIWNVAPSTDLPLHVGTTWSWGVLTTDITNADIFTPLTIYAVCLSLQP
jgi:hypothetical protein